MSENNKIELTQLKTKIAKRLNEGESRKMIADAEGMSVNTVHAHCREMFRMYGVHSVTAFLNHWRKTS